MQTALTNALFTCSESTDCSHQPPAFHSHQVGSRHQFPLIYVPNFQKTHPHFSMYSLTLFYSSLRSTLEPPTLLRSPHIRQEGKCHNTVHYPKTLFNSLPLASAGSVWWRLIITVWWRLIITFPCISRRCDGGWYQFCCPFIISAWMCLVLVPGSETWGLCHLSFSVWGLLMKFQDTMKRRYHFTLTKTMILSL